MDEDNKKFFERFDFEKKVLEAILVCSTTEEEFKLPTDKSEILAELINATIEYNSEIEGKLKYSFLENRGFEDRAFDYLNEKTKFEKTSPRIKEAIIGLVNPQLQHCPPERPYTDNRLYDNFNNICPEFFKKTFSLPYETVVRINKKFLPALKCCERKDIQEIGKLMRKYFNKEASS